MRCCNIVFTLALVAAPLCAQHHSGSPPTAPARPAPPPAPVSTGLGAIQFAVVNYGVPAPQSLTRQLRSDDDRTRASALAALGTPGQYLQHGHVPTPRSLQLSLVQLDTDDDLDAILTIELDQHIVSSILVPDGDNWRRVATLLVADPFNDTGNTPSTFVRTERSLLTRGHYRALFQATINDGHGGLTQNQAELMLFNKKPVITISFLSAERNCVSPAPNGKANGCGVVRRWFQPDPADPMHRFLLVSASGHLSAHEAESLLEADPIFDASHLRNFSCQPFDFSDQSLHFEPTGNSVPCIGK